MEEERNKLSLLVLYSVLRGFFPGCSAVLPSH